MTSTTETNPRCNMTAAAALWHYDLKSLPDAEKAKLAQLLTADIPTAIANEPRQNFNYELWDNQAFSLSKLLWQVESIARLGCSVVDQNYDIADEIHGGLAAIEELCKEAQNRLEIDLMRPVEKVFKAE